MLNIIAVDSQTRNVIRFIIMLAVIWLVVGLITLIPSLPSTGKTILTVVGAIVSILLVLQFFGLL
jgi:hypothetical protein